ncbi:metallopeptidase TldD-related protein [Rugosimonospora acidiphila]|uniref:Metallopeptidase TldD-related protein n=1 Tax=Rugosimonospora acidiphila TaxID=556531 RepID=A0ABP9RRN3_9ACTN
MSTELLRVDLAQQVLELVRVATGGTAQAEVTVQWQALALTRFANSYIHQNVADTTTRVRLRLHVDGRTAAGSTTLTDPASLRGLVDRTVAAARLCPPDRSWPGLAPQAGPVTAGTVDEAIVAATPDDRAALVRAFVAAAGGLVTAGNCRTRHTTVTFANSAGQLIEGAGTDASLDGIARTPTSDGVARRAAGQLSDLDGGLLGARAAAKARAGADPVELPPGRYEVVLEPTAVHDVLRCLAVHGFNGKAVGDRRSFAAIGEAQLDPSVTLVDDPVSPGAIGIPFDVEGTPKRRIEMVSAGVTAAVAHDRRTAAQAGTSSTGHASPGEGSGPVPANLRLLPSDPAGPSGVDAPPSEVDGPAADSSVAAMVAGVGRGVLVTDHWYTRVLDPRTLVMTGLTRNGVWLIEDGRIVRPVRNLRFTQSYPRALEPGAVLGIGTHAVPLPATYEDSSFVAPALRLASWNFTGGASG